MSLSDPIADLLSRIRNAQMARQSTTQVPGSQMKKAILEVLKSQKLIRDFEWTEENKQSKLNIKLAYEGTRIPTPMIKGLERISRPGRRVYVGAQDVPKVKNGLGVAILSTSQGVLSDRDARARNVGGELLCKVW